MLITSLPLIALTHTVKLSFHFLSIYACCISSIVTNCGREYFSKFEKVLYHDVYGMHYCFIMGGWWVSPEQKETICLEKMLVITDDLLKDYLSDYQSRHTFLHFLLLMYLIIF